jgi:predicted nucleic acid-binding protein
MEITLQVPDELGQELKNHSDQLIEILELGLSQVKTLDAKLYQDENAILQALVKQNDPHQILALKASPDLQTRISELLRLNKERKLTAQEDEEFNRYMLLEHLVIMAKAHAAKELAGKK